MFRRTIIPAVVAVFALVACTKEIQNPEFGRTGSTEVHSLSVGIEAGSYLPADETKASMEAIVRVKWKEDDAVSVVNASRNTLLGGCLQATESGEVVTFSGEVVGTIGENDKLYYIYPRVAENPGEVPFAGYEIDLSTQQYNSTAPSNVLFYGYAEDVAASANISKRINFNLVTSYVHLNMSNLPAKGGELTSVDLSNVNGGFKWVCNGDVVSAEPCLVNRGISVACTNGNGKGITISNAGNAVVRFAVPASPAATENRVLTVNKAYSNANYTKDERVAAKYYNQLYSTWKNNVTVEEKADKVEVTIDNGGSTEAAEGILPVEEAFGSKPASIEVGGIGNITFDATASEKILQNAESASATKIFFKVEDVTVSKPVENANLVYEVTMKTVDENGTEVFKEGVAAGVATVTVPLGDNVVSVTGVQLVKDGILTAEGVQNVNFNQDTHILTFEVIHFSKYAIQYTEKPINAVAKIGDREYETLASAIAAAQNGNTITLVKDVVLKKADALDINKNNVVLDGQGHTIALDETDANLVNYLVDGSSKKYGSFQMIKVSGNDVTLKNLTLDSKNYRGASLATTWGGKNASYENIVYKGLGSGHYYGSAGTDGTLTFKNCTFETHGYAIHTAECQSVLVVSGCEIHGWVSYGDKTKSATFTNTKFYSTNDQYNGEIATIRPYCATTITDCTFSKEYLSKYKYDGLTVRKENVVVSLNNCTVEDGEIWDIANITSPDDPWVDGGVIAIDATGNATDGFTAGTFVAKQATDIKAASGEVIAVEGKDYVFIIAAGTVVAKIGTVGYPTLAAAVAAVQDGQTITLVKNVELADPVVADKTFTLTLNANITPVSTWEGGGYKDGVIIIKRGGNLTINGTGGILNGGVEKAYSAVKMTQKDESETGNAAKLTVDGSVTLEGYYYGICGNGQRQNTEITINGGTIKGVKANDNVGIYHPQKGKLTINGGTIEGANGIYVKSGDVTASINAGTIKGVGEKKDYDPTRTQDGCDPTGDAIVFDNCGYPGGTPNADIKGGSFISDYASAIASYARTGYTPITGFISGGTFNTQPAGELIKEGYKIKKVSDAEYTVSAIDANDVATINGLAYADLNSALSALKTGETLKIWKAGEYTVEKLETPANTTVEGMATNRGVVFNHTAKDGSWIASDGVSGRAVKNITWNVGNAKYQALHVDNLTGCEIKGLFYPHVPATFTDCVFTSIGYEYCLCTWNCDEATFKSCTFNTAGKAVNVYGEKGIYTFEDCTFNATDIPSQKGKAAIFVKDGVDTDSDSGDMTVYIKNCTANYEKPYDQLDSDPAISASVLWNVEKGSLSAGCDVKVYLDGTLVYTNDALVSISTPDQLKAFAAAVNGGNTYAGLTVTLAKDLNLSGVAVTPIAIGNAKFSGTFDGNGKTISNMTIDGNANGTSLFGHVWNATIQNLKITNANVNNSAQDYTGILAGNGYANISNCDIRGTVEGKEQVGAVIGYLSCGSIKNCTVDATVKGTSRVGVLCAKANVDSQYQIEGNTIKGSATSDDIYAGGVVGQIMCGTGKIWTIKNNSIDATVSNGGSLIGNVRSGQWDAFVADYQSNVTGNTWTASGNCTITDGTNSVEISK